jgi:hypothetical protein
MFGYFINDATGIIENNSSILIAGPWQPCEPDCPEDKFVDGGIQHEEFFLGGCRFVVDYYYRYACETWCDFSINMIHVKDSACIDTYSVEFLMDYATVHIMLNTSLADDCKPDSVGCTTQYRVNTSGCMTVRDQHFDPTGGDVIPNFSWQFIYPCDGATCCFKLFQVCRDSIGYLSIVPYSSTSSGNCPQTDPNGGPCYDTCSEIIQY